MYQIDFQKPSRMHFIGIGGISMSALAEFMQHRGFQVSGSDLKCTPITTRLSELGVSISYEQCASNVTSDCSFVVYTAAVHPDNPEMVRARELGLPVLERKELLGQIMLLFGHVAGISGSHGKTTTTSMLSLMMLEGKKDPTIMVGGVLDGIEGNLHIGSGDALIAEACEYCNSFLSFHPTDAVILNVEAEHLDFFKDLEDIRHSFRRYTELLPAGGTLVINGNIDNYKDFSDDLPIQVLTYGIAESTAGISRYNLCATNVSFDENGFGSYDFYENGDLLGRVSLHVLGRHNVENSLAAIGLALTYGVSFEDICRALLKFSGTHRRFEFKGLVNGIRLYDDYAHHPSEIRATLSAARSCVKKDERLWVTYQPHTFSRTKAFLHEFADALANADCIVLADIYSASREKDPGDISSGDIAELLRQKGKEVYYFHSFSEIENFLLGHCQPNDLLITMGAGDIETVAQHLLSK